MSGMPKNRASSGKYRSRPVLTTTPFIQRFATIIHSSSSPHGDTSEEPLPEIVALTTMGLATTRGTRLTAVKLETTDDR